MIEVDTHVHTVLSGHAFSTIHENIEYAKKIGLKGFCTTDHGPHLKGSGPDYIPYTMRTWPSHFDGIRVYRSCEANIIDIDGSLDIRKRFVDMLDFVSGGLHMVDPEVFDYDNATTAYVEAYKKDYFDVATHIDSVHYPCDLEKVVMAAKKYGKIIELNSQSFLLREGSKPYTIKLIDLCKQIGANVVVSSDAHICYNIGKVDAMSNLLKEMDFPNELILNSSIEKFDDYIEKRTKRLEKA